MAKTRSIINFSGNFGGMTFVRSTRYGNHVRAKRGTNTPVKINEAFVASSDLLMKANRYAKLIKDPLNAHRGVQSDGTFWSRLVQLFRKQFEQSAGVNLRLLKSFRISKMTFSNALVANTEITIHDSVLKITVVHSMPVFTRVRKAYEYDFGVSVIFLDNENSFLTDVHDFARYSIDRAKNRCTRLYSLVITPGAHTAIVALKCQAVQDGFPSLNSAGLAMEITDVVSLQPG